MSNVSVVGLPDEKYGEVVAAFVIKHSGKDLTADDVRQWVRENLSGHLGALLAIPFRDLKLTLTTASTQICLLGGRLSQNSERQSAEVQASRGWSTTFERRERTCITLQCCHIFAMDRLTNFEVQVRPPYLGPPDATTIVPSRSLRRRLITLRKRHRKRNALLPY